MTGFEGMCISRGKFLKPWQVTVLNVNWGVSLKGGVGWGVLWRGRVQWGVSLKGGVGWGALWRGRVGCVMEGWGGVGCIMKGWVGCIMKGWGGVLWRGGVGWGVSWRRSLSWRGGVCHGGVGWVIYRGGVGCVMKKWGGVVMQGWGVWCVMKGWGGVCHVGVGWGCLAGVGWVMQGWGGWWRDWLGHEGVGWAVQNFMNCMKQPQGCIFTEMSQLYTPHFIKCDSSSPLMFLDPYFEFELGKNSLNNFIFSLVMARETCPYSYTSPYIHLWIFETLRVIIFWVWVLTHPPHPFMTHPTPPPSHPFMTHPPHPTPPFHDPPPPHPTPSWPTPPHPFMTHPTPPHPYMTHPHPTPPLWHTHPTPSWPTLPHPTPPLHDPPTHPTPPFHDPPHPTPPHPFMTHPTPPLHDPPTPPHPWYIFGHKGAFFHGLLHYVSLSVDNHPSPSAATMHSSHQVHRSPHEAQHCHSLVTSSIPSSVPVTGGT